MPREIRISRLVDSTTFARLCRARDFLAASVEARPRLAAAAATACLSPFHFHRLFRRVFGETPHEFQTRLRIERAKRMLCAGERSVTEICFEVGYESLGSFSVRFKERTGFAPSEFGRRARASVVVPARWVPRFVPACFLRQYAGLD